MQVHPIVRPMAGRGIGASAAIRNQPGIHSRSACGQAAKRQENLADASCPPPIVVKRFDIDCGAEYHSGTASNFSVRDPEGHDVVVGQGTFLARLPHQNY